MSGAQDNRFYREPDHLGVRVLFDRKQADQLLSHLCEVEMLCDLEPDNAAAIDAVRKLLADAICAYDRSQNPSEIATLAPQGDVQ